jgi:hypothetical protein
VKVTREGKLHRGGHSHAAVTGSDRPLTAKGQTAWPTRVLDADLHDASRLKLADYNVLNVIRSLRG